MLQSEERLRRIERATELPLLLLAVLLIPLLLLPMVTELPAQVDQWFSIADYAIWAAFALTFGAKLLVAPRRFAYVRSHPLEAAMVLLPFIRLLRFMRLLRVAVVLGVNIRLISSLFQRRGTAFVAACLLVALIGGGTLVFVAERHAEAANITSISDSLWWSFVTMTTVGYGDHSPITPLGRLVASFLMIFGIAALSVATGSIAALLTQDQQRVELADVVQRLKGQEARLATQLEAIQSQLAELRTAPPQT